MIRIITACADGFASVWDEHHNKIADLPPDLSMQSKTTAKVVRTILILHLIHT